MRYEMVMRRLCFEDEVPGQGYPLMFEHNIYRITWFGLRRVQIGDTTMSYDRAMEEMREDFISRSGVKFDVECLEDKMVKQPKIWAQLQEIFEGGSDE